jgi:predicted transcriptional regulator
MLLKDAIKHFSEANGLDTERGARKKIADLLGITHSAISQWGDVVPEGNAYKLQALTNKKLKVDPACYIRSA